MNSSLPTTVFDPNGCAGSDIYACSMTTGNIMSPPSKRWCEWTILRLHFKMRAGVKGVTVLYARLTDCILRATVQDGFAIRVPAT